MTDDARAHYKLGLAYYLLGWNDEAATAFREAVRLAPDSTEAHYGLCSTYVALNDTAHALAEYETLKRLDPEEALKLAALLEP